MRILLAILFGILSIGATFNVSGFEYEADLKVYTVKEINEIKPGLLDQGKNDVPAYYLYGWIRLKKFKENTWTIVPRCHLKAWSDDFNVSFVVYSLGYEKSFVLIPLGSSVSKRDFRLKIDW